MELLDVYDEKGEKTGKIVERGCDRSIFWPWEHIGVAIIYIENSANKFLIQKTTPEKGGNYSTTGGHINHGEKPIETLIREVNEELGINIENENIIDLGYMIFDFPIRFIFYLKKDIDLASLKLQESEVASVSYMSLEELRELIKSGQMHQGHAKVLSRVLEYRQKNGGK